ncbi:Putative transposase [Xenorhabdus nematophila AN6/1]|nr:Putative transposase [Xenorhabdus nematophila AN6/1]
MVGKASGPDCGVLFTAYSPELNPDENLNGDLKRALRHSSPARSQQE